MKIVTLAVAMLIGTGAANAAVQTKVVEYKQGDTVLEGYLAWDDAIQGQRPGLRMTRIESTAELQSRLCPGAIP